MARSSRGRLPPVDLRRALEARAVLIPPVGLAATLCPPLGRGPIVMFVQVGGGNDTGLRSAIIADAWHRCGFGTLLFDLLAPGEATDGRNVFNIGRLAERVMEAARWLADEPASGGRALGLFAAGTGAAAALVAAAKLPEHVGAVVSRGGRPDLAEDMLDHVRAPTLLIVGGADVVLELNRLAFARLPGSKALEIVPGASHLFTEPGALDMVILHATRWFQHYLAPRCVDAGRGRA